MILPRRLFSVSELRVDQRANTLMIIGFALPFIIGIVGLGVHTMQLTLTKRQLQREADSAALAGAYSLYQGKSDSAAISSAIKSLQQNNLVPGASRTITPGSHVNGTGTTFTQTVHVRLTTSIPTPFMALLGHRSSVVASEARAAVAPGGKFCYFALEEAATTGVRFQGNTQLDLGCGVVTNAKGSSAVIASGSAFVSATPVAAMGGVPPATNYAPGTVLMPNHAEIIDPFADNQYNPSTSDVSNSACKTGNSWKSISVASGTVATSATLIAQTGVGGPGCFGTISVQGTLTLAPGTYYLANGANSAGLQVGAQGRLICDGCTFVLTSTTPNNANSFSTINIHGSAELDLSPPISGTYEGMTMYRDNRAAASNQCCTINGNSDSEISGAFYFPKDELTFNGTTGISLNCFQMVAWRLKFTGNSNIVNTCVPPGGAEKWDLDKVRLIS